MGIWIFCYGLQSNFSPLPIGKWFWVLIVSVSGSMNFLLWPTILLEWMPCLFVVMQSYVYLIFSCWQVYGFSLWSFYFQKDNIRNQRENIVLAIANAQARLGIPADADPVSVADISELLPLHFFASIAWLET